MAFLRRLLFYAIGIGLGILIVLAFFGDRDFDYAHGPQARQEELQNQGRGFYYAGSTVADLSKDSLITALWLTVVWPSVRSRAKSLVVISR